MNGQTKVICADATCKWNGDDCVCTSPKIALSWNSVWTKYQGRREFYICKNYEQSEESKIINNKVLEVILGKTEREALDEDD